MLVEGGSDGMSDRAELSGVRVSGHSDDGFAPPSPSSGRRRCSIIFSNRPIQQMSDSSTIEITEQTADSLETVRREIPDTKNIDGTIQTLAWEFARGHDSLTVGLSGGIEHLEADS